MNRTVRIAVVLLVLCVQGRSLTAQHSAAANMPLNGEEAGFRIRAEQLLTETPVIDGVIDEPSWEGVPVVSDFVQMRPNPGAAASQRTEARVAYDDRYVYIAMRMFDDAPGEIAAQLARRDASGINSDWAHVLIDSYHDRRTAFRFSVNPSGVQKDILHYDDSEEDVNWDAVWQAAARIDEEGWTAEFRIPLSQLRFSGDNDAEERTWGINFGREIARHGEWSWWSPTLPTIGGTVSQAGEAYGLDGLQSPRRLEILPYSVARLTRAPGDPGNPFYATNAGALDIGGDLRYGVTSNLTLSATFNPDFGQVEADPSEVNLSAFESFFAERRPFFLEGFNIFSFGVGVDDNSGESLFYSRRIGRTPQRSIDQEDGTWIERPEATRILGAAKLSGRTSQGWTIGVLNALTSAEYAHLAADGRDRTRELVEPLSNYSIAALSRDFRNGDSGIGVMATGTHRRLGSSEDLDFLRDAAYTGGLRARHRFANRTWEANAYIGGSHIRGSAQAISRVQKGAGHYFQRPDADHLDFDPDRTSLSGAIANVSISKTGGNKIRGIVGAHVRTPGLELNDLGFQTDADQTVAYAAIQYRQYDPQWIFRSWTINLNPSIGGTTGGERTWTQLGHNVNFELRNLWNGGWWMGRRFTTMSTTALRGGPAIVAPGGLRYSAWLNSDRRRPLALNLEFWGGSEQQTGGWDRNLAVGLVARPTPELSVSMGPLFTQRNSAWQYISQHEVGSSTEYLFGDLDQTTARLITRVDYTISPTLSFQFYAQPFLSAGDYTGFMRVADPRAKRFEDRFHRYTSDELTRTIEGDYRVAGDESFEFEDPDFSFRQLRSNAVVRWEFRPGSALFLVWSQGRTGEEAHGRFELGRDVEGLMDIQPTNVFLVKASYWFNP